MSENRARQPELSALEHTCHVCHSTWASFGFQLQRGELWFCSTHRDEGIAMWAREQAGGVERQR